MGALDSIPAEPARWVTPSPSRARGRVFGPQARGEQGRPAVPNAVRMVPPTDPLAAQLTRAVRERANVDYVAEGLIQRETVAPWLTPASQRVIQRVPIGGIEVDKNGRMPSWEQGGVWYHLNTTTDPYHVTQEGRSKGKKSGATKTHFFFSIEHTRDGVVCKNAVSGQRGKKKFSELPQDVQTYVETNWMELIE